MTTTLERSVDIGPVPEVEQEFQRVSWMMGTAFSRREVEAAQTAAREFLRKYPGWAGVEFYHGFHYTVEYLEQREREARELGLTEVEHHEREAFLSSLRGWTNAYESANGLESLIANRQSVIDWLKRYPNDPTARSVLADFDTDLETTLLLREASYEETSQNADRQAIDRIRQVLRK